MKGNPNDSDKIFKLDFEPESTVMRTALKLFRAPLEKMLDFKGLNDIHSRAKELPGDAHFSTKLLEAMNITLEFDEEALERIPKSGKLVIVANHPFGGIEGVILGSLLQQVRPDSKILANFMLERIPELRNLFLFVNPFETREAVRENLSSMKAAIELLRNGHCLGVFPAGEVSHKNWGEKAIRDPDWKDSITKIIQKTEAPVLPIFFCGANGPLFQTAGLIHPRLRTLLLPRQFSNKENMTIKVRFGKVISASKMKSFSSTPELTRYLKQRTYLLQSIVDEKPEESQSRRAASETAKQKYEKIIDPVPVEKLQQDIAAFEPEQLLLSSNEYEVYYAAFKQIPNIIREIGRLREISFRDTDEGTGKSIDLDSYDEHYLHLFVWQREKKELVGAYRLGQTDKILSEQGASGLYTSTLFRMKPGLLKKLNPALEMGRSFVCPAYQRSFSPLLLLWKGIGHFVAQFPKYKILFGPVSISNDYETSSRNLMVKFLTVSNFLPDLAKDVKPRIPFKTSKKEGWQPAQNTGAIIDIDDVSEMVSNIEPDCKGVPILLKQYLKLGGKLLGFNIDPDFADALDGLILVDLTKTDEKILTRYMNKEGLENFKAWHRDNTPKAVN
ncbi:MAG: lysophospholipid acyltransferase family protein [Candidatus Cyclonatronum sp.]|uniref:lysophospholipid acyltransferase family protein n=1 Tax=Cyclonatronum sp. TaxID=3024185 RepID=UPI0025C1CB06|nr:GNAT family N-acyltransferase [Cyclonatronum sp.]MCC5932709.1 lysophospholipid acyltransferase family protein [Balneolales bacterium]MCH8486786.1 lysophospholipid acyltransferase family protein [Cyclonatronum sp.]